MSLLPVGWHAIFISLFTDNFHLDHLIKALSGRLLYCTVILFAFSLVRILCEVTLKPCKILCLMKLLLDLFKYPFISVFTYSYSVGIIQWLLMHIRGSVGPSFVQREPVHSGSCSLWTGPIILCALHCFLAQDVPGFT